MRFSSLGSGSKGNATLVHAGNTLILIDCGFSIRETEKRLSKLGIAAQDLTSVLVTHEHSDHLRGVLPLAKKHRLTVKMTAGTFRSLKGVPDVNIELIDSHQSFEVGSVRVTPVSVPHDAREPIQYVLRHAGLTLGILTDLGSITPHVVDSYQCCDALLLESNHDQSMLANGSYPPSLKERVASDWGHLNNQQALALLQQLKLEQLQQLVLGHISEKNNSLDLIRSMMSEMEERLAAVHYASQDQDGLWFQIQA